MARIPVALQLYTVRKQLMDDYEGTLRKIRELGYDAVQLTGHIPYEADVMKNLLDSIGLSVYGIHVENTELAENLDHWIEFAKALGTPDLVWPWATPDQRRNEDDWNRIIGLLDDIGARCAEADMRLSYHNHDFEFETMAGKYLLDAIYERVPADRLCAELDTYWIKRGGADPVEYIRKYSGRQPILHLKDMADDEKKSFAEVGNGVLDWPAIHQAALDAGVEMYAIEQDVCPGDPFESARMSLEYVNHLMGD